MRAEWFDDKLVSLAAAAVTNCNHYVLLVVHCRCLQLQWLLR
jgi:hypothetical protein